MYLLHANPWNNWHCNLQATENFYHCSRLRNHSYDCNHAMGKGRRSHSALARVLRGAAEKHISLLNGAMQSVNIPITSARVNMWVAKLLLAFLLILCAGEFFTSLVTFKCLALYSNNDDLYIFVGNLIISYVDYYSKWNENSF